MDPASALGYLCEGYMHTQQGRFLAATHVFDKALQHVNKHDPLYDTIQTAKAKAMQQREKRRDIICDLPIEISDRIIQQLFTGGKFNQQREYVMVSLTWWHRIMASKQLHYAISPCIPLDEANDMVIQSFNHTRSLALTLWKQPLGDLFKNHRFTRLTTLTVYGTYIRTIASTPEKLDECISALGCIGSQLTKLVLSCEGARLFPRRNASTIQLQHILTTCPDLESLVCHAPIDITCITDVYPKLRELKLYKIQGTVDRQHMLMIREHMPDLRTLDMAIRFSSKPLTVDDSWLPCIHHLQYGDRITLNHKVHEDIPLYGQQGLASFTISDTSDPFSLDDIAPIIIHHHSTLQSLEFRTVLGTMDTRKMMDTMHKNHYMQFKQLQVLQAYTLFIRSGMDTLQPFCNFIEWVIERAPYLHTVALKGYTMNQSSLRTLAKCMNLRHVDFEIHDTRRLRDYDTLVADFMRDHVDYMADKGGSRLESIHVQLYNAHPPFIDAMRELKDLTSFHLTTIDLQTSLFTQLFKSLRQGCQGLRTLSIKTDEAIPNSILFQISGLYNLRTFSMTGDLRAADASMLSLQRCRHLERIIYDRGIDNGIHTMLLQSNPHLQISYQ
ncbi:predicted protein [Lichtheimia corymbifera JMRC:FSU:9682]|uniref:Uncharacterized protein n=1 Tax=Lichtheimia corymbifera JMRC:FSU:9682 TaxID=1263082 RepID=A0A068SDG8_9FUNG|nr:predicted protein [Lichtheimia corymbifera JMRC:FSU:9682]